MKTSVCVNKIRFKLKPWTTDNLLLRLQKRIKMNRLLMKNPNYVQFN